MDIHAGSSMVAATVVPLVAKEGVPHWWGPLFQRSRTRSVFLSEAWMQSWLDVYAHDFSGWWIRWQDGDTIVAGCLLLRRVVWKQFIPLRTLYINATGEASERTPLAEFNDILCRPGYEQAVAIDFSALLGTMSWDRLLLSGHEHNAVVSAIIAKLPATAVEVDSRPAWYVDIAALPTGRFDASLAGKVGSHIRRNTRLFEKQFGDLGLVTATSLDEAMHYFRDLSVLHNARWRSKGQDGSFSSNSVVRFHECLIRRLWPEQAVDMVRVSGGLQVIGYLYNFTSENKVCVFQTGFVYGSDTRLSPGLLTHTMSIEHYRQRGFREYDLLAGDAPYKRALAGCNRALHWTVVYRDTLWMRLVLALRALKSRLAKHRRTPEAPEATS